jgi:hypothetical protein
MFSNTKKMRHATPSPQPVKSLKRGQSRCPSVEGQRAGAAGPGVQCPDQSIFKLSHSVLQSEDGFEDLLLVLELEGVRSEQVLHMQRNLGRRLPEEAAQHPDNLEHGSQIDEAWILIGQLVLEDSVDPAGLVRVVLQEISEDHVGRL